MKSSLIQIIQEAGQKVLSFYGDTSFSHKKDNSPVTHADKASHGFLTEALPQLCDLPVLSEEDVIPYEERKNWGTFWMIDPLDGTKEFINGYDDFCINVALIQNQKPVLGVIYGPKLQELYYADLSSGFEYRGSLHESPQNSPVVAISRFHHSDATKKFMELNNLSYSNTIGAGLKFGRMALGLIDIYPRFEGSKEWDTAAGQMILETSGGTMMDLITQTHLIYNKKSIQNNYFIALRSGISYSDFNYRGLM